MLYKLKILSRFTFLYDKGIDIIIPLFRLSYKEAVEILQKNNNKFEFKVQVQ